MQNDNNLSTSIQTTHEARRNKSIKPLSYSEREEKKISSLNNTVRNLHILIQRFGWYNYCYTMGGHGFETRILFYFIFFWGGGVFFLWIFLQFAGLTLIFLIKKKLLLDYSSTVKVVQD
jgi:hypothetical protein